MALALLYEHARDRESAVTFLRQNFLLRRTPPNCTVCNKVMSLIRSGKGDEKIFRCPSHKGVKASIKKDSFWENKALPLNKIVELMLLWAYRIPTSSIEDLIGISNTSVLWWTSVFRDVCSWWLVNEQHKIGGPGAVVQVDESLVADLKNNFGTVVGHANVVGGVCPSTLEGFLVVIPDKSASTLLSVIQEFVVPGSIIQTDELPCYDAIEDLPHKPAYQHILARNRKFVDPFSNAGNLKNYVECFWERCKRRLLFIANVNNSTLASYLDEFVWREIHGRTHAKAFKNLMAHIAEWYPTP